MTNLPTSQGFMIYEGFNLNVTTRMDNDLPPEQLSMLTELTIKLWAWCTKQILQGIREVDFPSCPLDKTGIAIGDDVTFEPLCTVWGDVENRQGLTVHSHTYAQQALNVWWARHDALDRLGVFSDSSASAQANNQQNAAKRPSNASTGQLPDGVVIGRYNPSTTRVYYEHDQLIALPIIKWVLSYKDGWIYEAWSSLGSGQYPALKIWKNRKGSDQNSESYMAVKEFLEGLQLDPEKKSIVSGKWYLIGKINHQNDREFFNVQEVREQ